MVQNNKKEKYFKEIIQGKKGFFSCILQKLLSCIAVLFSCIVSLRSLFYTLGIFTKIRLNTFVISIGNIAVGGVGKTPVTLYLAKRLRKHVACVLGGYRSKASKSAVRLSCEEEASIDEVGDEAALFRRHFPEMPLYIGKKWKAASLASQDGIKGILIDDGMQHLQLARDVDIVVLDARNPFGPLLPRGLFRESKRALRRVDCIIINHGDGQDLSDLFFEIRKYTQAPCIVTKYAVEGLFDKDNKKKNLKNGELVGLFCGIAQPDYFFKEAAQFGLCSVGECVFSDHTICFERLLAFSKECEKNGASYLVTTEKDIVRSSKTIEGMLPIFFLSIELIIVQGKEQLEELLTIWKKKMQ